MIIHAVRTTKTSIMIQAYAGTGKTSTLSLICKELTDSRILALSFNKQNQLELQKRMPRNVEVMTLNSLGNRAWMSKLGSKRLELDTKKITRLATEAFNAKFPKDAPRRADVLASKRGANEGISADIPPPDLYMKSLVLAAVKYKVDNPFLGSAGARALQDTPATWEWLASQQSLPKPTPHQVQLAKQMLIDHCDQEPKVKPKPIESKIFIRALTALVDDARSAGLVPSNITDHKGLIDDTEAAWKELAGTVFSPTAFPGMDRKDLSARWMLLLARKILIRSIREAEQGVIDFDDQIYCSALLGGAFKRYKVTCDRSSR
jgi:hypothetical protein